MTVTGVAKDHGRGAKTQRCQVSPEKLGALVFWLFWLSSGLLIFCWKEEMHVVTALYVMTQMLTTIGYGDLTVQSSDSSKILIAFYALATCLMMTTLLTWGMEGIMSSMSSGVSKRVRADEDDAVRPPSMLERARWQFVKSVCFAVFMILVGTLFFGLVESCTCSYAESSVDGCDPNNCEATGGSTKSFLDAFYMSCISLTTIGFGDYSLQTEGGRIFGIFWLVFGVLGLAFLQVSLSWYVMQIQVARQQSGRDLEALFTAIDSDKSNQLDKYEFMIFCLAEYGLVDMSDIEAINDEFDMLDKDGSGHLSKQEIMAKFDRVRAGRVCGTEAAHKPAHTAVDTE